MVLIGQASTTLGADGTSGEPDVARADVRLAMRRAGEFRAAGRSDEAEHDILRAVALQPGLWQAWRVLGLVRLECRRFRAAVDALRLAAGLAPGDAETRRSLASALHMAGDDVAAEAQLRALLAARPDDAEALHNLGLFLNRTGKLPEAEGCFRKASGLRPDWPVPVHGLGAVFLSAGLLAKASDCFRRADRMQRGEPDNDEPPVLRDAPLSLGLAEDGLDAAPLGLAGDGGAQLVRFRRAVVERVFAMPIAPSGRFYSQAFAVMRYPDKYAGLWRPEARRAVVERLAEPDDFADALIVSGYAGNYGHWLLDALPACLAVRQIKLPRVTLLADELPRFRLESLVAFGRRHGLPAFDIAVTRRPFYSVANGHFVTSIARRAQVAAVTALRQDRPARRLLFIGRRGARHRHLINEEDVFDALAPLGFERFDPAHLGFDEQLALFSEARAVVGVQGAALANCMFAAANTPLVILYAGRLMPFYRDLAHYVPLRMIEAIGDIRDSKPDLLPEHCSFVIDPQTVAAAARDALDTAAGR
ncbi:MAG: DUF563 domain-containing protein [Alphaproteobacteria bacterium]|nr:DUF563 domain-containing protein [Alphaproteobacteria bacterium]